MKKILLKIKRLSNGITVCATCGETLHDLNEKDCRVIYQLHAMANSKCWEEKKAN